MRNMCTWAMALTPSFRPNSWTVIAKNYVYISVGRCEEGEFGPVAYMLTWTSTKANGTNLKTMFMQLGEKKDQVL